MKKFKDVQVFINKYPWILLVGGVMLVVLSPLILVLGRIIFWLGAGFCFYKLCVYVRNKKKNVN